MIEQQRIFITSEITYKSVGFSEAKVHKYEQLLKLEYLYVWGRTGINYGPKIYFLDGLDTRKASALNLRVGLISVVICYFTEVTWRAVVILKF
jgi:hypothetical protein